MKLERYLRENGLRPTSFAEKLNVAPSTVTRILKKQRRPGPELLSRIVDLTGGEVQPNDFYDLPESSGDVVHADSAPEAAE